MAHYSLTFSELFFRPKGFTVTYPARTRLFPLQMKGLIMPHHPVQGGVTFIALNAFIVSLFPFYHRGRHENRNQGLLARFLGVPESLLISGDVDLPQLVYQLNGLVTG